MAPPIKFVITAPPPSLPQQANILHHWDLTDLSTLWQDTARTMPVTTDLQNVKSVDNQGTSSLQMDDESDNPNWDAGNGATRFNLETLNSNPLGPNPTSPMSMAFLGYEIVGWQSLAIIPFFWDSFDIFGVRNDQNGSTSTTWDIWLMTRTALSFTTLPSALDTPYSMIGWGNADPAQKAWSSLEAAPITDTQTFFDITTGRFASIGANQETGANGINGRLGEVVVWENYQLTDADVEEIKVYDTAKHGTVWAT